jgi:hypothetical protein
MVARAGGLLASRQLLDSVVFDLCRGPGTIAQVLCSRSRASIERSSEQCSEQQQQNKQGYRDVPSFFWFLRRATSRALLSMHALLLCVFI